MKGEHRERNALKGIRVPFVLLVTFMILAAGPVQVRASPLLMVLGTATRITIEPSDERKSDVNLRRRAHDLTGAASKRFSEILSEQEDHKLAQIGAPKGGVESARPSDGLSLAPVWDRLPRASRKFDDIIIPRFKSPLSEVVIVTPPKRVVAQAEGPSIPPVQKTPAPHPGWGSIIANIKDWLARANHSDRNEILKQPVRPREAEGPWAGVVRAERESGPSAAAEPRALQPDEEERAAPKKTTATIAITEMKESVRTLCDTAEIRDKRKTKEANTDRETAEAAEAKRCAKEVEVRRNATIEAASKQLNDKTKSKHLAAGVLTEGGAAKEAKPKGLAEDVPLYKLMPGDRVAVTVFGDKELSGKFSIERSGAITIPIVGRVIVANLTLEECQRKLAAKYAQNVLMNPTVSVHIDEYRQIYVYGNVKTPGAYPYQIGMTAVGAMAVAGGAPTFAMAKVTAASELVSAKERVRVLSAKRQKLIIRVASLEAQRDKRTSIELSSFPPELRNSPDIEALVNGEHNRLKAELGALRNEVELLQKQKPLFDRERQSLLSQIDAQNKLLAVNKKRRGKYDKLAKQGLSRTRSVWELVQQEALIEATIARLNADKFKNELKKGEVELQTLEKHSEFNRKVLSKLNEARHDRRETEILLQHARKVLVMRRQVAGVGGSLGSPNSYVIYRSIDGQQRKVPASASTPVEPGDIVEVKKFTTSLNGEPSDATWQPNRLPPRSFYEGDDSLRDRKQVQGALSSQG